MSLALGLWGLLALAAWCLPDTAALAVYGVATQTRFVVVALILLAADAIFDLLIAYLRADFRMRRIAALTRETGDCQGCRAGKKRQYEEGRNEATEIVTLHNLRNCTSVYRYNTIKSASFLRT